MDNLRREYEKTALHRMGIPMQRALERVSWLRAMLESGASRNPQPAPCRAGMGGS